ncbi:MAG: hypothetical protein NZ889_01865 [Candidatus Pacearchaeota archaeon]|nr:hypothetical protein [Candidatus Pacearchaeota archaeon]
MKTKVKKIIMVLSILLLIFLANFSLSYARSDAGAGSNQQQGSGTGEKQGGGTERQVSKVPQGTTGERAGTNLPTCNEIGGTLVKKGEIEEKCAKPLVIYRNIQEVVGSATNQDDICCKPKEPLREAVKKPGRLGRLESCFGRYWLWGKESEERFLNDAKKELNNSGKNIQTELLGEDQEEGANKKKKSNKKEKCYEGIDKIINNNDEIGSLASRIANNLSERVTAIEQLKKEINTITPEDAGKKIDGIKNEILHIEMDLAELAGDLESILRGEKEKPQPNKTIIEKLERCLEVVRTAQKNLDKAQQNLERAKSTFHVMTTSEVVFNMLSCLSGMVMASDLAFDNLWGAGLGFGLGLIAGMLRDKEWKWVPLPFITANIGAGLSEGLETLFKHRNLDNEMGHCSAEVPLKGVGTEVCRKCNEDPYRICTRERCLILGNCIPVPTAKGDQYNCIPGKCEEFGLPLFKFVNVSWYVGDELIGNESQNTSEGKNININLNESNPIPYNTNMILINLSTDQPAQCRYILNKVNASFSEMHDFENYYFPVLPDGSAGFQYAYVIIPGDLARDPHIENKIFVKCKNACGVEPAQAYDRNIIKFKLGRKPDQLPPEIVHIDPAPTSFVRGDLAFVNASFWLDEKGSCKFSDKSTNFTINYTKMIIFGRYNNENSSVVDGGCYDARCIDRNETCSRCFLRLNMSRGYEVINYTGTEFNETKMYRLVIRCSDIKNNVMPEDAILDYVLMTAPPYEINITKPEANERTYERQPEIEVSSGTRLTECRYRIFEYRQNATPICTKEQPRFENMWPIGFERGTLHKIKHNETLNATPQGFKHMLCVKCRDFWNIEAMSKIDFYVLLDPDSPAVIRIYRDTSVTDVLIIETNEEAECVYSDRNCNYNFSDGTSMMSTDKFLHAAPWQLKPYYIKCKDKWENYPGKKPDANACSVVVYPYEVSTR